MKVIIIKKDSPSWNALWGWLEKHPINTGLSEPMVAENNGEVWQYMGTTAHNGKHPISSFRHREHPIVGGLKSLSVIHDGGQFGLPTISADDIEPIV
jgi:hypothetical protein